MAKHSCPCFTSSTSASPTLPTSLPAFSRSATGIPRVRSGALSDLDSAICLTSLQWHCRPAEARRHDEQVFLWAPPSGGASPSAGLLRHKKHRCDYSERAHHRAEQERG